MLSRTNRLRISTKLTLVNAAILVCILVLTSLLTVAGIYFAVYHQAEVELASSIGHTLHQLESTDPADDFPDGPPGGPGGPPGPRPEPGEEPGDADALAADANKDAASSQGARHQRRRPPEMENRKPLPGFVPALWHEGALLPGVVLRVTDADGDVLFDSAEHYPSLEEVETHIEPDPPFWANKSMKVVVLDNFYMYYEKVSITRNGKSYELHFLRMITAERQFLQMLQNGLLLTNGIGLLIALLAGYFVSRRTLTPIRTITQAARAIEITDLGRRIPVPLVEDELSELVETFNLMLDRLQAGFEQQRRFVSDASHELRTPVTVIRGYSDLLSRWGREDPTALDEGIAAIRSEAEDMQQLIEKLLFLARADQKRQVLHRDRIDLQAMIAEVAKQTKLVAKQHTVTLLANDAAVCNGDAIMLKQMLRVFIENSLKYTPAGGTITISSVREGNMLRVVVADTGIGIAPENQQKVFERFFRVDSARTKVDGGPGGTGLGLAIARWIADAHSIELSLTSELGKGTRIQLRIPLAAPVPVKDV